MELAAKIAELTEDLEELRSEKALLLQQFEYAEDAGAEPFRKDIAVLESNLQKLDEQEQKYSAEVDAALHKYCLLYTSYGPFIRCSFSMSTSFGSSNTLRSMRPFLAAHCLK